MTKESLLISDPFTWTLNSRPLFSNSHLAGADAVEAVVKKAETLKAEAIAYRELSSNMSFDK